MRVSSQKSSSATQPVAKIPTRKRGIERVAKLLDAAAAVFAEKGYKTATMTEIAQKAGAPIGSLYQFFPSKDVIADALVARYMEHVGGELDGIRSAAAGQSAQELANQLLDVFIHHAHERSLALSLLDARWEQPGLRPGMLRSDLRASIAGIVRAWRPLLEDGDVQLLSVFLLQTMKSLVQLHDDKGYPGRERVLAEWRRWVACYLSEIGR
ncbi:TetR/AcrR family transcriptional regulator [Ciceribacter sp. L1K22]|uniref:TetR/AcrR family transcriptional regulator n=1 Tax=Ciceribacter sp. L1K22 TaxID=2820275 RepID=UPI001ABE555A|nr:TetR/AcrR family transcriptional regulator [Ciceribacter sp. L1K22]MBO3759628.1 TetR/AcrR family transcriptional regulator [Ciceribacter sp. L1K22]